MPVDTQTGTFVNVDVENARTQAAQQQAQQVYWQAMASNAGQQNALTAAQNAFENALKTATLSGYFGPGVGNGTVAGQPTMPNIQYTTGEFGQYYPGGFNTISPGTPTQAAIQYQQGYGLSQAGVTGVYYDPGNMTYKPGTFIRDPSTNAIGQIQSNGRMVMFGDQGDFLRAGGSWDMVNKPDMMRNVSTQEFQDLNQNANANFGGRSPGTASLDLQKLYGTYGLPTAGAPTMELQAMYGGNAAPYAGQQTLAQQKQAYDQAVTAAGMTGMWSAPQQSRADLESQGRTLDGKVFSKDAPDTGMKAYLDSRTTWQQAASDWARDNNDALVAAGYQGPGVPGYQGQGQQTLTAQEQYWNQAFAQSQANQTNTLAYLKQLADLRGPADWAKYQQVLGSTPQGMRDLYSAAMGQYVPGGGATSGVQPQAANLQTMQQQIGGQGYGQGWGTGGYQGGYTTQPGQPQTPQTGYTSQAQGQGSDQVWGSGIGIGQQGASAEQQQQATGNGTNMWGASQQQYNLPAPNQIAPQSWANMAPSQQQMLLGMYEANGWSKPDVTALFSQSLPKYAQNQGTAGTWRMQ